LNLIKEQRGGNLWFIFSVMVVMEMITINALEFSLWVQFKLIAFCAKNLCNYQDLREAQQ